MRILPLSIPLVAGESFTSYVDRLAWSYSVSPGLMLRSIFPSDVDTLVLRHAYSHCIDLPDELIAWVATVTGLSSAEAESSFLARAIPELALQFPDPSTVTRTQQWAARRGFFLRFTNSLFCPKCLLEDNGAWQLAWRRPTSFVCLRHRLLLVSTCPGCNASASQTDYMTAALRAFLSWTLDPSKCRNRVAGCGRPGLSSEPCGTRLSSVSTLRISNKRLLAAQEAIHELESPRQLAQLYAVMRYAMRYALPDDLGPLPDSIFDAFDEFTQKRVGSHLKSDRVGRRVARYEADPRVLAGPLELGAEIALGDLPAARERFAAIAGRVVQLRSAEVLKIGREVGLDDDLLRIARDAAACTRRAASSHASR